MKIRANWFILALFLITIYEVTMVVSGLSGISIEKILITLLIWFSFGITIVTFIAQIKSLREDISRTTYLLIIAFLVWNLISIIRSIDFDHGSMTTMFGNVFTTLALLIPFSLIFALDSRNLLRFKFYTISVTLMGFIYFLLLLVFNEDAVTLDQQRILFILFTPLIFLITIIPFQNNKTRAFILFGSLIFFLLSMQMSHRTMQLRIVLLYIAFLAVFFSKRLNTRWILKLAYISLLVPFILLISSFKSGQSAFSKYLPSINDREMASDTRTFLYKEVLNDLTSHGKLIIGKGANGTYFSRYFRQAGGDTDTRLTVEVGLLSILLKGGVVAVMLNLSILFIAIYNALFRSNNYYIIGIGFILVVHAIILFFENVISYSLYNFMIWFFIGVSLSKSLRDLDNEQITDVLRNGYEIS